MNSFTKNGIVQKIIIAIVFIILFNCIYPCIPVYAAEDTDSSTEVEAPFGVLLEPLIGLITGLGEGIIWLIQSQILGLNVSNIYVDMSDEDGWNFFWGAVGAITGGAIVAITTGGLGIPVLIGAVAGAVINVSWSEEQFPDNFYLPLYAISPAEIFSDQIPALHINFINPESYEGEEYQDEDGNQAVNSAKVLAPQIAKWYVALRNLVLIGLMVVLLYIGIRIVISSTAGEKAKYKEHIKDWLVAVVLVVFMHYIMAFAMTVTEYITAMLDKNNERIEFTLPAGTAERIQKSAEEQGIDNFELTAAEDGSVNVYTNLMGYARLMQQMESTDANGNVQFTWNYIGYAIIYMVLVIYTVMFLIIYLKRVIYMAFLTMIAPLVALTYPIDKISDGQAQAFNMWLKDYVYNLLLQPFHLLLYTMLVGSVMDLATENMIYAIVALGFLLPAEQLLRKFFGFEKSDTTGSIMGGVVGGSMAMNAINSMRKIGSAKKTDGGGKADGSSSSNDKGKTRLTDRKPERDKRQSSVDLLNGGFNDEDDDNNTTPNSGTIRTSGGGSTGGSLPADSTNGGNSPGASGDRFNAYEPLEIASDIRNIAKDKIDTAKVWASNSAPVRFANARRSDFNNWLAETPKTKLGRDAKKIAIRGAKNLKAAGGTAIRYTGKGLAAVGKKAPRVLTKAALGAAIGTAGVAAGVASGDLSNIAAYGAAGIGVGASVGEGVSNIADNVTTGAGNVASGIRDDYERRRYTKAEREARQNAKADKEWRNSKDVQKRYQEEFGREKDANGVERWKKAMDKQQQLREYGITDDDIGMKVIKDTDLDKKVTAEDVVVARTASSIQSEEGLQSFNQSMIEAGVDKKKLNNINKRVRKINPGGNFVQ